MTEVGKSARITICTRVTIYVAIAGIAFGLYGIASQIPYDSDMVQNYLELRSVWAGAPLLPHWILVSDNFYLTDLPFYVALSLALGTRWMLLHLVPWLVYVLLLLAAASLAAEAAGPRGYRALACAATLFFLGMLFPAGDANLLVSAYHNATILFSLLALRIASPVLSSGGRPDWRRLVPIGLLVFAIAGSDPFGDFFFIVPLVFVLGLRLYLRHGGRESNLLLLLTVVAAGAAGALFPLAIALAGGFRSVPSFSIGFAAFGDLAGNARAIASGFIDLFAARPSVLRGIAGAPAIAAIRLAAALSALTSVAAVLLRARNCPEGGILHVLAISSALMLAADLLSNQFAQDHFIRYVIPVFIFSSIAASALFARISRGACPRVLRKAVLCGAAGAALLVASGFAQQAVFAMQKPPAAAEQWQTHLARWLALHDLHYGIGDYWTANVVEALSGGKVAMSAVLVQDDQLQNYQWVTDLSLESRYGPPQFAAFTTPNTYGVTQAAVTKVYGRPAAIYHRPDYVVMVFGLPTHRARHQPDRAGLEPSSIASR